MKHLYLHFFSPLPAFLLGGVFVCFTAATVYGAGIRFEGETPQQNSSQPQRLGGLPPEEVEEEAPNPLQRRGGLAAPPSANLLNEAQSLRERYRTQKAANTPAAASSRFGIVAAFFDSKSLLKPTLIKALNKLEEIDGVELALFLSHENLDYALEDRPLAELEALTDLEPPFAREDAGGTIAKQYGVTKFPTILYETPSHDVITFDVTHSLDYLFERIGQEKRKGY